MVTCLGLQQSLPLVAGESPLSRDIGSEHCCTGSQPGLLSLGEGGIGRMSLCVGVERGGDAGAVGI